MKVVIFAVCFLLVSISAFGAGNRDPDFVIANGTGYEIREVTIRPSRSVYPRNNLTFSISDLEIVDTGILKIFLEEDMREFSSFDIAVRYDGDLRDDRERLRWIRAGNPITINHRSRDIPVFSLSIRGERNTVANLGLGAAAGAAVPTLVAIGASIVVGAPVIVLGAPVFIATALVGGVVTAFGPFVSQDLVIDELGDFRRLRRTLR